jgi:hypothetical protein
MLTKNAAYAKKAWSGVRISGHDWHAMERSRRGHADRGRGGPLHQQRRQGCLEAIQVLGDVAATEMG